MERNNFTIQGCAKLATAILESTREDYIHSLKWLKKNEEKCLKISKVCSKWFKWEDSKKASKEAMEYLDQYERVINQPLEECTDREFKWRVRNKEKIEKYLEDVRKFKSMKKPKKPSDATLNLYRRYIRETTCRNECEVFYRSVRYKRLTMNLGIPGEEVIRTLRGQVYGTH